MGSCHVTSRKHQRMTCQLEQHMGQAMGHWLEVVHAEMPLDTADKVRHAAFVYARRVYTGSLHKSGMQALFHGSHGWLQLGNACQASTNQKVTIRSAMFQTVCNKLRWAYTDHLLWSICTRLWK